MEAILTISILAALIWGVLFLVRGGLIAGCLAVLIAGSCLSTSLFEIPVKPMPITLDRVLWAVLMAQYVLWRRFGKTNPKPFTIVDGLLAAMIVWLVVGCMTHSGEVSPLPRLFFSYLMPLGLYWVAKQADISRQTYKASLVVLVVFGAYLAITAVGEVFEIRWLVLPHYPLDPANEEFLGRARGPYLNPAVNGLVICLSILAAIFLWQEVPRRWRPILAFLILLFLLGVALTQTRCVWMGAVAALAILMLTQVPRGKRIPVVVFFMLLGATVLATQWESLVSFKRDKELTKAETAESAKLRPILAVVAWKMFKDHPLDGVGLSQYDENAKYYLENRVEYGLPIQKARDYTQHNVFLSLLTETGLIGVSIFIAILVFWAYGGLKLYARSDIPHMERNQGLLFVAFLAAYLANAMFQDVSQIAMVNMFLFFEAGLTMNFWLQKEKDEGKNEDKEH